MTVLFSVLLLVGILMMFSGLLIRAFIPVYHQHSYAGDFTAALAMFTMMLAVLICGLLTNSTNSVITEIIPAAFGEALEEILPFYRCINVSSDVIQVYKNDLSGFFTELLKVLFMNLGLSLLNDIFSLKFGIESTLGKIFWWVAFEFLYIILLAWAYNWLVSKNIIGIIVNTVVSIFTFIFPFLSGIVLSQKFKNGLALSTIAVILLWTPIRAASKTIVYTILYIVAISVIATHMSDLMNSVGTVAALFMAFMPAVIGILGIWIIIRCALF